MFGLISPALQRGVSGLSHNLSGLPPPVARWATARSDEAQNITTKVPELKHGANENLTDFRRPSDTAPKYLTVLHRCPKIEVSQRSLLCRQAAPQSMKTIRLHGREGGKESAIE